MEQIYRFCTVLFALLFYHKKNTRHKILKTSLNHVFFMHMNHKLFTLFSDCNCFIHEQVLDVINNLCWKKDDWVAAVYDNECYPGVVAEVG